MKHYLNNLKDESRRELDALIKKVAGYIIKPICEAKCEDCKYHINGKCFVKMAENLTQAWEGKEGDRMKEMR